jgi:transposase-like protein
MKRLERIEKQGRALQETITRWPTNADVRHYLEGLRWPNGTHCPHCGPDSRSRVTRMRANQDRRVRDGLWQCLSCRRQFTVTSGTALHNTHLPLRTWVVAALLFLAPGSERRHRELRGLLAVTSTRHAYNLAAKLRHLITHHSWGQRRPELDDVLRLALRLSPLLHVAPYTPARRIRPRATPRRAQLTPIRSPLNRFSTRRRPSS